MTEPGSGSPSGRQHEQVLAQALRAMAGGPAASGQPGQHGQPGGAPGHQPGQEPPRSLTSTHLLLLAAIVGVLVGGAAAILTLLL